MQNITDKEITQSCHVLEKGQILLYPTDTVWGIGCDATNPEAVQKIFRIKKRSTSKSLIVLVDSLDMLRNIVTQLPQKALDIIRESTRPTTIIYKNTTGLAPALIAEDGSVAIRIVQDAFCRKTIQKFGKPIVSTSANISGEKTPVSFSEIPESIKKNVDYIVALKQDEINLHTSRIIRINTDNTLSVLRDYTYPEALENPVFSYIQKASGTLHQKSYVIGGFVRDYFLQRGNQTDIDIVTVGSGIELAKKFARALPGKPKVQIFKTYGTAMVKYQNTAIEFVGARKESYSKESRNPQVKTGTLADDQNRRDFTINAMAFSLNTGDYASLLDPFNGKKDLKDKIIRTPGNPDITYSDDPLRMLRAIRFATQLGFEIEANSLEAIRKNASRIRIITPERIATELHKILAATKPSTGFLLLEKTGLLPYFLPELSALKGVDEIEGERHKDNFYHTLEVVDNIAKMTDNLWLRWAALLHDIGKAPTKKFHKKIGWTFHGHEFKGSKMVKTIFKRLKMPLNDKVKFVQKMVMMSSRPIDIVGEVTDSAVRRLVFDAGEHLEDLMKLCDADITTKNEKRFKKYRHNFQIVRQKIKTVEERDRIRNFQPPISGELIMKTFNLKPSREIGIIKEAIKEAILEGEIPNEYEACYRFMLQKGKELGL